MKKLSKQEIDSVVGACWCTYHKTFGDSCFNCTLGEQEYSDCGALAYEGADYPSTIATEIVGNCKTIDNKYCETLCFSCTSSAVSIRPGLLGVMVVVSVGLMSMF